MIQAIVCGSPNHVTSPSRGESELSMITYDYYVLGGSVLNVSCGRQFSQCIFWEAFFRLYVLGGSVLNVSFGRHFFFLYL